MISEAQCTGWLYLFMAFTACSIFSECLISVDRYLGVVQPLRQGLLAASQGGVTLAVAVWTLASLVSLPVLLRLLGAANGSSEISLLQCHLHQSPWYVIFCEVIIFLLPLSVMEECYRRLSREVSVRARLMNNGILEVKTSQGVVGPALRVHRGGSMTASSMHRPLSPIANPRKPGVARQTRSRASQNRCPKATMATSGRSPEPRGNQTNEPATRMTQSDNFAISSLQVQHLHSSRTRAKQHEAAANGQSATQDLLEVTPSLSCAQPQTQDLLEVTPSLSRAQPQTQDSAELTIPSSLNQSKTQDSAGLNMTSSRGPSKTAQDWTELNMTSSRGQSGTAQDSTEINMTSSRGQSGTAQDLTELNMTSSRGQSGTAQDWTELNMISSQGQSETQDGTVLQLQQGKECVAQGRQWGQTTVQTAQPMQRREDGQNEVHDVTTCWPRCSSEGLAVVERVWRGELKTTVTVLTIMAMFILLWLPYFLLLPFCSVCWQFSAPWRYYRWCTVASWLGMCHSFLNPFVYAWAKPDFRRAFYGLLRCQPQKRRVQPLAATTTACSGFVLHSRAAAQHRRLSHTYRRLPSPNRGLPYKAD